MLAGLNATALKQDKVQQQEQVASDKTDLMTNMDMEFPDVSKGIFNGHDILRPNWMVESEK